MKKKIAVILTAMLMVVFALTACGGSKADPVEGKWTATKMKAAGVDVSLEEFAKQTGQEISITLEFTADGKVKGDVMGQTGEGTWKAKDGGKYDVTMDGGTQELSLADGLLTMEMDGAAAIFEKQ